MASLNRGQPPAWHTKVVHQGPGCLKAGSKGEPTVVMMLCPQSLLMTSLRLLVVVISLVRTL